MNLQMLDLNLLLVFEAVHAEGNLTRAAKRLNLSQPAVSNALRRLRDTLGDPLFIRTRDGMQPTDFAGRLAVRLDQALAMLRGVELGDDFDPREMTREFRIAISDYNSAILLPGLLRHIQQHAPGASVTTSTIRRDALREMLSSGQVDLAVSMPQELDGLHYASLFRDSYVGLAAKGTLSGEGLPLDEFCCRGHVLYSLEGRGQSNVDTALSKLRRSRRIVARTPFIQVIPQMIEGTELLTILPARAARQYMRNYSLDTFPPPVNLHPLEIGLHWHGRQHHDPAHEWFRTALSVVVNDEG